MLALEGTLGGIAALKIGQITLQCECAFLLATANFQPGKASLATLVIATLQVMYMLIGVGLLRYHLLYYENQRSSLPTRLMEISLPV